jgi:hypothetical protein
MAPSSRYPAFSMQSWIKATLFILFPLVKEQYARITDYILTHLTLYWVNYIHDAYHKGGKREVAFSDPKGLGERYISIGRGTGKPLPGMPLSVVDLARGLRLVSFHASGLLQGSFEQTVVSGL